MIATQSLLQSIGALAPTLLVGVATSVIGVEKDIAIGKFLNSMPARYTPATGDVRLCGVIIDADEQTGHARSISRLELRIT